MEQDLRKSSILVQSGEINYNIVIDWSKVSMIYTIEMRLPVVLCDSWIIRPAVSRDYDVIPGWFVDLAGYNG
jgi:hypothetical protein